MGCACAGWRWRIARVSTEGSGCGERQNTAVNPRARGSRAGVRNTPRARHLNTLRFHGGITCWSRPCALTARTAAARMTAASPPNTRSSLRFPPWWDNQATCQRGGLRWERGLKSSRDGGAFKAAPGWEAPFAGQQGAVPLGANAVRGQVGQLFQ